VVFFAGIVVGWHALSLYEARGAFEVILAIFSNVHENDALAQSNTVSMKLPRESVAPLIPTPFAKGLGRAARHAGGRGFQAVNNYPEW